MYEILSGADDALLVVAATQVVLAVTQIAIAALLVAVLRRL